MKYSEKNLRRRESKVRECVLTVKRLMADPLTHFLALGLVIFGIYAIAAPNSDYGEDRTRIIVDRDNILTFLQFRTKTFQPEIAEKRFRAMNPSQRQKLIDDYVREEALFRESEALGLGENGAKQRAR